jgi:hypothetical protein
LVVSTVVEREEVDDDGVQENMLAKQERSVTSNADCLVRRQPLYLCEVSVKVQAIMLYLVYIAFSRGVFHNKKAFTRLQRAVKAALLLRSYSLGCMTRIDKIRKLRIR